MRFLINRTDAIGDLVVSLPVVERILSRAPQSEIHFLVRSYVAPLLENHPGVHTTHIRPANGDLEALISRIRPDALLNLYHRDRAITVAAKRAGVPIRVARARGVDQIFAATHLIWKSRYGTGQHESQNLLDFLRPFGWGGGWPQSPRLFITEEERAKGETDLAAYPRPRLGLVLRGSGAGAHPSEAWWARARSTFRTVGWNPVALAPIESSDLPETGLRGLMGRIQACDAVISPSTGPAHIAAALGVPLVSLLGLRPNHSPDRWAPMGSRVQIIQYPGPEADLQFGLDRLDPADILPALARLR